MGRYCLISLASGEASARQLGPERVELQERTQVLNPPGGVLGDVSVAMQRRMTRSGMPCILETE
jgi:hypothetical protein